MRRRGSGATTFLIALVVVGGAGSILYFVNRSVLSNNAQTADTLKMRNIFRAIDLYEMANNDMPPSDLTVISHDVGDLSTFVSSEDPFTTGQNFPLDPAFPDAKPRSPFRISFTYLPQWIANHKVHAKDWRPVFLDSQVGLLACYWYGDTGHLRPDGLDASGPIIRIAMDGSAKTIQIKNGHPLQATDLFNLPKGFLSQ